MSQQNTVLNGPNGELTMAFKDVQPSSELPIQTPSAGQQPQLIHSAPNQPLQRPVLQRVDSRARLPFPPPFRPQSLQQIPGQQPRGQFVPRPPPNLVQRFPISPLPQGIRQPINPNLNPQPTGQSQQQQPGFAPAHPPNQQRPFVRYPIQQSRLLHQQSISTNSPKDNKLDSIEDVPNNVEKEEKALVEPDVAKPAPVIENQATEKQATDKQATDNLDDEKAQPPKTLPLQNDEHNKHSNSPSPRPPSVIKNKKATKKDGDNDSGVDESTQGNDPSSNGNPSPRKSMRNCSRLTTPTKNRSFSQSSRSPNPMTPDSMPSTPGTTEKKKLPMNKIQVGAAPSPNLKVVKSRIGSLANASHKPGGGNVKIEHRKIDLSNATSRIGAKNETYQPSGGEKKILSQKLQWNAKSKIGSLENTTHKPKGGEKKIETVKLDFKDKAKSKVGSKDNIKYVPGGGEVKSQSVREENTEVMSDIEKKKLNIKGVESKIGSFENFKHKPGGGDKKIFDDKDYMRQISGQSESMIGSQNSLLSQASDPKEPISDENLNRN